LVQPELLKEERNKNSLSFFQSLCRWSTRHTNWNIYAVTNQGKVYHYQDGIYKQININLDGDCNHTIAVSNFIGSREVKL
jgi:hypothetical protein